MSKKLPIRLRIAEENDVAFIFNSWLKSYRNSYFAKNVSNTIFFSEHHKLLEKVIKANKVVVACKEDDPDQICGWICAGYTEKIFTLHYIYVKHPFRSFGVAKTLLNAFEHDPSYAGLYSHQTKAAERLAAKYNMVYHPYVIINDYESTGAKEVESEAKPSTDESGE